MEKVYMKAILLVTFLLMVSGFEATGSKMCKTSLHCAASCQLGRPKCVAGACLCEPHSAVAKNNMCKTKDDCAKLISDPLCKASDCTDGTCIFVCQ